MARLYVLGTPLSTASAAYDRNLRRARFTFCMLPMVQKLRMCLHFAALDGDER